MHFICQPVNAIADVQVGRIGTGFFGKILFGLHLTIDVQNPLGLIVTSSQVMPVAISYLGNTTQLEGILSPLLVKMKKAYPPIF